jgi:hypothetical protein
MASAPTETVTILEENSTFATDNSIPSDVLVQRQLQDIILTQKSVIERLNDDVSAICLPFEFSQVFHAAYKDT